MRSPRSLKSAPKVFSVRTKAFQASARRFGLSEPNMRTTFASFSAMEARSVTVHMPAFKNVRSVRGRGYASGCDTWRKARSHQAVANSRGDAYEHAQLRHKLDRDTATACGRAPRYWRRCERAVSFRFCCRQRTALACQCARRLGVFERCRSYSCTRGFASL